MAHRGQKWFLCGFSGLLVHDLPFLRDKVKAPPFCRDAILCKTVVKHKILLDLVNLGFREKLGKKVKSVLIPK